VEVDVVVIESGDVAIAIAEEVSKHGINKLVIGASSRGFFTRYSLKHGFHPLYYHLFTFKNRLEMAANFLDCTFISLFFYLQHGRSH
jgi:K+-sensing histidine kinase KdpD